MLLVFLIYSRWWTQAVSILTFWCRIVSLVTSLAFAELTAVQILHLMMPVPHMKRLRYPLRMAP